MKYLGIALSLVIMAFWGTMNALVVLRQQELQELGKYRRGVDYFLNSGRERDRWMSVYRNHKKVGYTGFHMEKVPLADQGFDFEFYSTFESVFAFDLFGKGHSVKFDATLTQDNEMRPTIMQGEVTFDAMTALRFHGRRVEERFVLSVMQGTTELVKLALPLDDFHLSDGLIPTLPVAGFEVGDTFRVPSFDPVTMSREIVHMNVVSSGSQEVDGLLVDVFTLQSTFRGMASTSLVTRDGVLLRQSFGPPLEGVVLRKDTRERARHGVDR